jgi:hypothetical protein
MYDENMLSRSAGLAVPIAIAVAIVPGPVVSGMVSGKNAILWTAAKLAVDVAWPAVAVGVA